MRALPPPAQARKAEAAAVMARDQNRWDEAVGLVMSAAAVVDAAEAATKRSFGAGWAEVRQMSAGRTARIRALAEEALRTLPTHCYGEVQQGIRLQREWKGKPSGAVQGRPSSALAKERRGKRAMSRHGVTGQANGPASRWCACARVWSG